MPCRTRARARCPAEHFAGSPAIGATQKLSAGLLAFYGFELNLQLHPHQVAAEAKIDTVVGAVERAQYLGAAGLSPFSISALQMRDFQVQRLGYAMHRQTARDSCRVTVLETRQRSRVGCCRELRGVENVRSSCMVVHRLDTEIDRIHVHGYIHCSSFGFPVEYDRSRSLPDLAAPDRESALMVCGKGWVGVSGVDVEGDWLR